MTDRKEMTAEEILRFAMTGVLPVHIDPACVISDWSFYKISFRNGEPSFHAVGIADGSYRICSPIQAFYPQKRSFTTRSGRQYTIVGDSYETTQEEDLGGHRGASMARGFSFWCKSNGVQNIEIATDVFTDAMKDETLSTLKFMPDGSYVTTQISY